MYTCLFLVQIFRGDDDDVSAVEKDQEEQESSQGFNSPSAQKTLTNYD